MFRVVVGIIRMNYFIRFWCKKKMLFGLFWKNKNKFNFKGLFVKIVMFGCFFLWVGLKLVRRDFCSRGSWEGFWIVVFGGYFCDGFIFLVVLKN